MVQKFTIYLSLLLCAVCGSVSAQQGIHIIDGDTIRYSYTPLEGAQSEDNSPKGEEPQSRWIDFKVSGGVSYTPSTNFGIGALAMGVFRLKDDLELAPSHATLQGAASLTGFYTVGSQGRLVLDRAMRTIEYKMNFSSSPRDMWGIGYDAALYNPSVEYTEQRYSLKGRYLEPIFEGGYIGGDIDLSYTNAKSLENIAYINGQSKEIFAAGVGLSFRYDTKDRSINASRGLYADVQAMIYPQVATNFGQSVWRTTVNLSGYQPVWGGATVAGDLYAEFCSDGTPWAMLARMGDTQRMRGYYAGRFTDNNMVTSQIELRQRVWQMIGVAAWVGAGNVFSDLNKFDIEHTLPSYGVGVRFDLSESIRFRLDYGLGRDTSGFVISLNEAF